MLWYLPFSESIKKRACRYLLQRYLGNFLEEKLTLDQLSVDLYNGTGTVSDVSLDCEALNDLGDAQNWPLEIVDGHMKEITVTVPWSTLLKDDSVVEINGLSVTVQPKVRAEPVSSMLESMWSSMSSSMQLAAECLREEAGPQETNPVEGIEMFAHAIDSILSRVKVKFINTKIRIEHVPKNGDRGIALEIHIKNVHYFDEAGTEPVPDATDPEKAKTYIVATYTNKKIKFDGVTFYIDEFPSKLRTMAPSLIMEKSASSVATKSDGTMESPDSNYQSTMSDIFYETRSVISTIESDPIKEIIGEQQSSTQEATPEERSNQPEPILFAKLGGSQELSLKLKHSDEVEGPKVEVKILLGSFLIFLTPRQLHTIIELIEALNQPHLEDTSNIPLRPNVNMQCKPMKHADFQFIEAQLLGNLEKQHSKPMGMYGWSGPSFEESDAENDKFLPMTSQAAAMAESFTSSVSSMNTSMTSSVNTSSSPKIRRNKRVPHIDGDPTAEVSHISVRVASLSCVLLHKDVLIPTLISGRFVTAASASKMQQLSTEFFNRIDTFSRMDDRKLSTINKSLDTATDRDHLRLLALEISMDGSEKVTAHGSQTVCEAAVRNLLLRECLYHQTDTDQPMSFDLVKFENKADESESSLTSKSNLKINFKQTSKYMCVSGERKLVHPTTDIVLKCMPFHVDIELSVLDRVCASVWPPPRAAPAPPPAAPSHNHLSFALQCPDLALLLRFPISDLRPGVDRDARRVRPDYLVFKFQNATLSCTQTPSLRPLPTTLALTSTILDLYYYENEHATPTHIARSTMDDSKFERNILKGNAAAHLPTISLTFQKRETAKTFDSLHDELSFEPAKAAHPMTTSMYIMNNLRSTLPSPFSGKKMAHQSINKNEANTTGQEEEIIVPGTDEEMAEFTTSAVDNSGVHLDFSLPVLSLQLESKQMYEIIYNRINSDLLLWEPRGGDGLPDCPINPAFGACRSAAYDSDSESSTSDEENLYYSTYDGKAKKNAVPKIAVDNNESEMHNFCLTFKVGEGLLTIYAPVRDSNKRVVPGQTGELSLRAGGLRMCHVSGLRRRARTAQLSLRAADLALHHEPILTLSSEKPSLRVHGSVLPSYLKSTIYRSHSGVLIKDCVTNKDIFTMALKTEPDPETPGLKTICIALGIEQATLRHRGDRGVAWLTQLMDVLDVVDYPVAGYTPSTVLSELHVHVWDCAVDYRPLYLPIRTILTLGNFSVSSNIIPDTSSSHLRFLAQECALFLSRATHDAPPNVRRDYVCVLDLGLFELSVRTDEKSNGSSPALSVSASNNMVNVYTCWDSASALCRLLTYVAADGDAAPPRPRSNRTSVCSDSTAETLVGLEDRPIEEIRELSPNEIQQVNDLMAEAMKESPNSTLDEDELNSSTEKEGVEVFFFPDENMKQQLASEAADEDAKSMEFEDTKTEESLHRPTNTQVTKELGDPTSTPKSTPKRGRKKVASGGDTSNTDDEYCMVEDAGDGEMDEPVVNWLGSSLMVDNHFAVPPARADVLAAPKSFPTPVTRYTLCELSLTWHLYGGTDFTPASDAHAKKTVTIDTKRGSPTPSRSKETAAPYLRGVGWSAGGEAVWAAPAPAPRPLRTRGGPKRDHNTCVKLCLTKVKFQHETYGGGGAAASRQTLAVARLEVLDRVQRSDINKLLSQYRRDDEPERKNAHMLVVKAVHLRTDAALPAQECCLKVSLLPLRFILDQDTLAFLVGYFSKLGSDDNADDDTKSTSGEAGSSRQSTPTHRPPVMSIASHLRDPPPTPTSLGDHDALSLNETVLRDDEPLMETYEAERLVSENLIQLEEDFQRLGMNQEKPTTKLPDTEPLDDSPIYFRRVVFSPEVPIRLDYVGKRVDLSAGPVAGLLMGLGQLNCSELTLKRLDYKLGLLGVERLVQWALAEWVSDIKRHQLPGLLGGIGPMHSLLQILTGIRDLVWLPVEQWRRDGRVVRGLRRGAASFTARAALAALDLTARLLHLIQATAETAFDMLTPSPPLPLTARGRRARRRRADNRQPADIREGVASAYTTVKEGFAETAAQMRWAARRGHSGGVLRQLPGAALTPLALAAAGAADVLGGVRAHIAPRAAVDQQDKWRAPDVTDQS